MSELEKTAQEIASEALNFTSKEYYKVNQMNETNTVNHEALTKIASLPQLTIPKSIAEQADKTDLDSLFKWGQQEFYQWFSHEQDEYLSIIYAYLAGKALGVDLVKVVEND